MEKFLEKVQSPMKYIRAVLANDFGDLTITTTQQSPPQSHGSINTSQKIRRRTLSDAERTTASLVNKLAQMPDFQYNHLYDCITIPYRFEKFIFWSCLLHVSALIYNLVFLPVRVTFFLLAATLRTIGLMAPSSLTVRAKADIIRLLVVIVSSYITIYLTNPSTIYHWIRGQGNFKLYLLKVVCEIVGLLLVKVGQGVIENFTRELLLADLNVFKLRQITTIRKRPDQQSQPANSQSSNTVKQSLFRFGRKKATLALFLYTCLHAWVLAFEMFVIHVVLTIQHDSWFTFVFLNCLSEMKISVFKKCDFTALYNYAHDDSVDRLNLFLFMVAAILQTSQDIDRVIYQAIMLLTAKMWVDFIKHFFLTRFNKINISIYEALRLDTLKRLVILRNTSVIQPSEQLIMFQTGATATQSLAKDSTAKPKELSPSFLSLSAVNQTVTSFSATADQSSAVAIQQTQEIKFRDFKESKSADKAQQHVKWGILSPNVLDSESALAISRNYLLLPHLCLLLRTTNFILLQWFRVDSRYRMITCSQAFWQLFALDMLKVVGLLIGFRWLIQLLMWWQIKRNLLMH